MLLKSTASSIGKLLWAQLAVGTVATLFFSGVPRIGSFAVLFFLVMVALGEKFSVFEQVKMPSFRSFWQSMLLIYGIQLMTQSVYWVLEVILKPMALHQDLTLYKEYLGSGWNRFLFTVILAPFTEELLFRGFLLRRLQPYGVGFALLATSMIFALQHGILAQIFFAFFMGIILGAVALRFGLRWSLLFHALNNLLVYLNVSLLQHDHGVQEIGSEQILWVSQVVGWVNIALGVGALLYFGRIIWQKRGELKAIWIEHRPEKGLWRDLLTNGWMITFLIMNVLSILFMLIVPNLPGFPTPP